LAYSRLEHAGDRLDLGMVGGDAGADQAPGRGEAVKDVDGDLRVGGREQLAGGVEPAGLEPTTATCGESGS
jgi:hypothetical protein